MDLSRPCFKRKSINLYNLMEKIWPCGNIYTAVCKDAAYGFQWGLSQKMNIGKSRDPADISKMTCEDIDDPQVSDWLNHGDYKTTCTMTCDDE